MINWETDMRMERRRLRAEKLLRYRTISDLFFEDVSTVPRSGEAQILRIDERVAVHCVLANLTSLCCGIVQ